MTQLLSLELEQTEHLLNQVHANNYEPVELKILELCEMKNTFSKMCKIRKPNHYFIKALEKTIEENQ